MSNQATADPAKAVRPWGIEADHPRNADLWIKTVPGMRLRGAISSAKPVIDKRTGRPMLPVDQVRSLGVLPATPGMQLVVNPAKLEYVVIDPLYDNPALLQQFNEELGRNMAVKPELRPIEPQKGVLNRDEMKTLCREMLQIVLSNEAKVCQGAPPSIEDIDAMPGDYLLNPGILTWTSQPKYEKDFEDWARRQAVV